MTNTLRIPLAAALLLALAMSCGCVSGSGLKAAIAERIDRRVDALRSSVREQVQHEVQERAGQVLDRAVGIAKVQIADELNQRGIDPESLRQRVAAAAAEHSIDLDAVKRDLAQKAGQVAAQEMAQVVDAAFGNQSTAEFKQEIVDEAAATAAVIASQSTEEAKQEVVQEAAATASESGRRSALAAIASKAGPLAANKLGATVAGALGMSGPIGAGLGFGLWFVARALHRRRKEEGTQAAG